MKGKYVTPALLRSKNLLNICCAKQKLKQHNNYFIKRLVLAGQEVVLRTIYKPEDVFECSSNSEKTPLGRKNSKKELV